MKIFEIVCEKTSCLLYGVQGRLSVTLKLNKTRKNLKSRCAKLKPLGFAEKKIWEKWMEVSLQKVIESSETEWRSTLFVMKKPDKIDEQGNVKEDDWRVLTPHFAVAKPGIHVPTFIEIRCYLTTLTLVTLIDLRETFFQFLLCPDSTNITALQLWVRSHFNLEHYLRGWATHHQALQGALNRVLQKFLFVNVIVYCDDTLMFTNSPCEVEQMKLVNAILGELQAENARINFSKTQECRRDTVSLGAPWCSKGWKMANKCYEAINKKRSLVH